MIALAATAIEGHGVTAMRRPHGLQALSDLRDCCIPGDRIKAAVGAPTKWCGQPIAVVDIGGYCGRLIAQIALRPRIGFVAAHLDDDFALALPIDRQFDAAIDIAKIAG